MERGGKDRVELQMSLELGFTAMRVFMKYLRGDFLMDMPALLVINLQILDVLDTCGEHTLDFTAQPYSPTLDSFGYVE